jgi:uncharacterized membrane protein YgcG
VTTALVVAACLGLPASAVADPVVTEGEGAVSRAIPTSPREALRFWTEERLEEAEPLPVVTLPGEPEEASETGAAEEGTTFAEDGAAATEPAPAGGGPETAAVRSAAVTRSAAVEGIEVSFEQAKEFPYSANGKIYVAFEPEKNVVKMYECSGSVVRAREANEVLTAAHCVMNEETGELAKYVIFYPGYRQNFKPLGSWVATRFVTTPSWGGPTSNEGEDLAFLKIATVEGENVEERVGGGLGIAFDQACSQTYTQYGYPGEAPYDGEILYSHAAAYAGADTNPLFSPAPIKIATDFTRGASGGPWTIGPAGSPSVVSLTAYGYENQPGYLYGPYFGEAARKAYNFASDEAVPAGTEAKCEPLPHGGGEGEGGGGGEEGGSGGGSGGGGNTGGGGGGGTPTSPGTPNPSGPGQTAPLEEPTTPKEAPTLQVTGVNPRANGSAVLIAKVGSAGTLTLSGTAVRAESVYVGAAGKYRMIVAPKGRTTRKLRRHGRAKVGVKIAFRVSGKTRQVSRKIQLKRRSARAIADRAAHQRAR